jgi:hypothetical protein
MNQSSFSLFIEVSPVSALLWKLDLFVSRYITFLVYNTKISDNNAESGIVPRMLAAFPRCIAREILSKRISDHINEIRWLLYTKGLRFQRL